MSGIQVSRKLRQCSACGRAIPPGTRYWWLPGDDAELLANRHEHTNCEQVPPWPEYVEPKRPKRRKVST